MRKAGQGGGVDRQMIFNLLRKRIAEELKMPDLEVDAVSQLELSIGTFVPSEIVRGYRISDYPFIGARYVSRRDGHVYAVAGSTADGLQIMAYRLGFIHSVLTSKGGMAVGIDEDGWMASTMILYSIDHAHFAMQGGVIESVSEDRLIRRVYPMKKLKVYGLFLKSMLPGWLGGAA